MVFTVSCDTLSTTKQSGRTGKNKVRRFVDKSADSRYALSKSESSNSSDTCPTKRSKCVLTDGPIQITYIVADQEKPAPVWNVYVPVRYVSRREQQQLLHARSLCKSTTSQSVTASSASTDDVVAIDCGARERNILDSDCFNVSSFTYSAALAFVRERWGSLPVENIPSMRSDVEIHINELMNPAAILVFNDFEGRAVHRVAALRIIRHQTCEEGTLAFFSQMSTQTVVGYIPISCIISVSEGAPSMALRRFVERIRSTDYAQSDVSFEREIRLENAFSVDCFMSNKSVVFSFIAYTRDSYVRWINALNYIVSLNSAFKENASE